MFLLCKPRADPDALATTRLEILSYRAVGCQLQRLVTPPVQEVGK
jgi:hypothetical protein